MAFGGMGTMPDTIGQTLQYVELKRASHFQERWADSPETSPIEHCEASFHRAADCDSVFFLERETHMPSDLAT